VGVIGSGLWAGHYLRACRAHPEAYPVAICNPNLPSAERMAERFDVPAAVGSVDELLERDYLDAVAIVTPNDSHAQIALAALAAGKHVLCEKPMAMDLAEARQMACTADQSGLVTGINFTWRHPSAAQYARHLVASGELGRIYHVQGCFLQSWLLSPKTPLVWRLRKEKTGTGTLGDIGSHIIDLAEWVTGEEITALTADLETFTHERPLPDGSGNGPVDVDDAASLMIRLSGGGMGHLWSTRYATAQGMDQRLEIYGEKGALVMDFHDQEHLRVSFGQLARDDQFVDAPIPPRFRVTPEQYLQRNVKLFLDAIAGGTKMSPDFAEGLRNQEVLEAVTISARDRSWVTLPLEA
jgi:predicted dehydrogenase